MMKRKEQVREQKEHGLFYAAVFFCFFALYAVTAQSGVGWQDSGEFQYRILAGDYQWHSGIARAHPFYILMASGFVALFPKGLCFYAINLFSGLGLALALALLAHNVMRLTRSLPAAVAAAGVLGFAHMAWWMGTIAEVYTWSLAFLMAEILCLIHYSDNRDSRWLVVLFGVNGLHWGIHNVALLGLPVYVFLLVSEVWERSDRCWKVACWSAVAWLSGGGMIVWLALNLWQGTGDPVLVLKSVLFGDGYEKQVLGTGGFAFGCWSVNMALAGVSLLNPWWALAGRGLFVRQAVDRPALRNWLVALTVLHGVFWARYFVPDQATFVLPTLGLLAVWVGIGCSVVCKDYKVYATLLTMGLVCAVAGPRFLCDAVERTGLNVQRSRELPYRDELRYWLVPWKQGETSAARFVSEVGKQLGSGDVLFADSTAAGPLLAAREAGLLGKEWRLMTPWSDETGKTAQALALGKRMFVVSPVVGYAPKAVLESASGFEKQGVLYKAIKQ